MAMQMLDAGDGAAADPARGLAYGERACEAGQAAACLNVGLKYHAGKGAAPDPAKALARFARACDLGGPVSACAKAAELLDAGKGAPRDARRAAALYDKACKADSPSSCTNLGRLTLAGDGVAKDPAAAAALFEKACAAREPFGCHARGETLDAADPVAAATWYSRACNEDHGRACAAMARLVREGRAGYGDGEEGLQAAAQLFELACAKGDALSCVDFAALLHDGRGVAADRPRALKMVLEACDAGNAAACQYAGIFVFNGAGGAPDPARARALLQKGCDGGRPGACQDLATLLHGDPATRAQALPLFGRACRAGAQPACVSEAVMLIQGEGVPVDAVRGMDLLRASCDAKHAYACTQLGIALVSGYKGVLRDAIGAAQAFDRGCGLQDPLSCGGAGVLLYDGAAGKADPVKALPLLEAGCRAESPWACERLARMHRNGEGGLAPDVAKANRIVDGLCAGEKGKLPDRAGFCWGAGMDRAHDMLDAVNGKAR
jgi:TPR repeat protein